HRGVVSEQRTRKTRRVGQTKDGRDIVPVRIDPAARNRNRTLRQAQGRRPGLRGIDSQYLVAVQQYGPDSRNEVGGVPARLVDGRRILVAHAVIEGDVVLDFVGILPIQVERVALPVGQGRSSTEYGGVHHA